MKATGDGMFLGLMVLVGAVLCGVGISLLDPLFVEEVSSVVGSWMETAFGVLP